MPAVVRAIALGTAVATLAGCGGTPAFDEGAPADVPRALTRTGLEICAVRHPRVAPGAVSETGYVVALACDDDGQPDTLVRLICWEDRAARDEAVRRFESQARPAPGGFGAAWAYGPCSVSVSGTQDDDAYERVAQAMDRLGAS